MKKQHTNKMRDEVTDFDIYSVMCLISKVFKLNITNCNYLSNTLS